MNSRERLSDCSHLLRHPAVKLCHCGRLPNFVYCTGTLVHTFGIVWLSHSCTTVLPTQPCTLHWPDLTLYTASFVMRMQCAMLLYSTVPSPVASGGHASCLLPYSLPPGALIAMAVPPFKRYKPSLTHTGTLLASGLAAAMDLMSPATPGPNTFALDLCVDAKLHPHPWARLQAVLASNIAPPLMQLAAAQQLPRLFALWQSHDEDLVATEMSLRSNVSTSQVCAHVSGATRVTPPSPDDIPAMATAPVTEIVPLTESCPMPQTLDGCMLYPAMSDLLVPPVPLLSFATPSTCPSADHRARSAADQCACSAASGLASHDVTCTFSPVMPKSSALPVQCCPPHTGNIVDCVNPMPVGFAMSSSATESSGTSVQAHNGAASMLLARPVEPPHVEPLVTSQLQESSGMPLAWPPASLSCWWRVIL